MSMAEGRVSGSGEKLETIEKQEAGKKVNPEKFVNICLQLLFDIQRWM